MDDQVLYSPEEAILYHSRQMRLDYIATDLPHLRDYLLKSFVGTQSVMPVLTSGEAEFIAACKVRSYRYAFQQYGKVAQRFWSRRGEYYLRRGLENSWKNFQQEKLEKFVI